MFCRFKILFIFLTILLVLAGPGCTQNIKNHEHGTMDNKDEIVNARRFRVELKDGWTEVGIINPWQGATNVTQIYYLVKRGSKLPSGLDSSEIIFVPLKKIVCMSTTYIAMICELGEEKSIIGVSGADFVYSPGLAKNVANGSVADVGYEANLNKELILKLSPDLIMIYGIGSESSGYVGKIKELGIKIIINADYLETDPLGRAEWIKLFGALYCKENLADSIYNSEVDKYNKLKSYIHERVKEEPKVLLGLPFKDTWYVSPGNSYISTLITDAGGSYLWSDIKSEISMPYGIENVFLRGMKADFWLNISTVSSRKEISAIDQRLENLPCYKNDNLFNNNNRVTAKGGNDFWESGILYPHLLLKDIATILHPELFTDHELVYYRKIY
jgi:iron complex transport system substrate-binding protein